MPMGLPLRQQITVYKPGHNDGWNPVPDSDPVTYKCRFQETVKVVKDDTGSEVVSTAQVFFDQYPNVTAAHVFRYLDEHGSEKEYRPVNVSPKRWLNGKPVLTVVYLT